MVEDMDSLPKLRFLSATAEAKAGARQGDTLAVWFEPGIHECADPLVAVIVDGRISAGQHLSGRIEN